MKLELGKQATINGVSGEVVSLIPWRRETVPSRRERVSMGFADCRAVIQSGATVTLATDKGNVIVAVDNPPEGVPAKKAPAVVAAKVEPAKATKEKKGEVQGEVSE